MCNLCGVEGQGRQIKTELKSIKAPKNPLDFVTIDILKLPETDDRNTRALVAVDYLTKMVWVEPMKNEKAVTLSRAYQRMFQTVGYPKRLLSDQGSNFRSAQFQDLCLRMNVQRNLTTQYHPQGDGATEKANRTIINRLAMAITETQWHWVVFCPSMVLAMNSASHAFHGKVPYELFF